tara:strand:+ start:234 stop:380 length:147 start_codon:yes stop_codon:yes gene_type:complete
MTSRNRTKSIFKNRVIPRTYQRHLTHGKNTQGIQANGTKKRANRRIKK